ncbi:UDP-glucosyltransferase 29-like [Mangifera indica]|uniref:UDP-glucosyltransferase 29-like n=1 Tax=Mangifera indica TaxID=29780 RepID=UPI001CFAB51F|nr:UDP-glucosyltransferase 29-like [Mangifera indica]
MVPVGPLVQDPDYEENNLQEMEIIKWLDKKGKNSAVLVSFGSEYFLSREEMAEIADGLEKSEANFIWVVRFPNREEKIELKEKLPEGFVERISSMERGTVVEVWAPQARVLAHDAVGGFLDQPLKARLVEDVGIGIEARRKENGELVKEEIASVIKEVMKKKNGEKVRRKAREMSERVYKKERW